MGDAFGIALHVKIIELSDEIPTLRMQLMGYMSFPNDEAMRKKFFLMTDVRSHSRTPIPRTLSADEARMITDNPSYDSFGSMMKKAAMQGGYTAGLTLIALIRLYKFGVPDPGLGKAQWLVAKKLEALRNEERKTVMGCSDASIRSAWSDFQTVSHLCAAHIIEPKTLWADSLDFLALACGVQSAIPMHIPNLVYPKNPPQFVPPIFDEVNAIECLALKEYRRRERPR
jgi:hypothetical protein